MEYKVRQSSNKKLNVLKLLDDEVEDGRVTPFEIEQD